MTQKMANKMTHKEMQDRITETVIGSIPENEVTFRSMFGGVSGYVAGRVFASLSDIGLALKLAPDAQVGLLNEPEAKRLRYEPDAPESKQYIVVPVAIIESDEAFASWVVKSIKFVLTLPAPKPKKAKGV